MNLTQQSFLVAGLSCLTTSTSAISPHEKQNTKPNIIFILADDLGYGDLSCQGGKDIRTPHIDLISVILS